MHKITLKQILTESYAIGIQKTKARRKHTANHKNKILVNN